MRPSVLLTLVATALTLPSAATARDRDHDALPDAWERQAGLSTAKKSAEGDPDRDGVDNRNELRQGTRARVRDTDHDGRNDGREDRDRDGLSNAAEDLTGNDPRDRDSDDDGLGDGREPAGIVASFDQGVLTIRLARGGTVSGSVTADTAVDCASESSFEAGYSRSKRSRRGRNRRGARRPKHARASQSWEDPAEEEEGEEEDESSEEEDPWGEEEEELGEEEEDEDLDEDGVEDEDEDEDEDDEDFMLGSCGLDALTPGARVRSADLSRYDGALELFEIELLR